MREIKFRGYSREDEKWYYGFVHNSVSCLNGKQSEHYFIRPIEKIDHIFEDTISFEIDKDSIGQYTGFKDKNGVEIYEGDIIKTEKDKELCQVIFDEYSGMWKLKDLKTYMRAKFSWHKCEVIGNTYEERLKDGN